MQLPGFAAESRQRVKTVLLFGFGLFHFGFGLFGFFGGFFSGGVTANLITKEVAL